MFTQSLCCALIFAGLLFPARQTKADETNAMGQRKVLITAMPIIGNNRVDRYGACSTVITEKQIRDLNAQDLATSLRRTPGVTISRYNPIGSHGGAEGGAVFIRGMGSSRPGSEIKTFIDGVPMYIGVWNHPLLDLLSIDTATEIEVYKSPQPQRFGNAFGAINLIPKRQLQKGFRTHLHLAGGSHDTLIQSAEHAGKTDAFDYYLGQSFRTTDGHREKSGGELVNYFTRLGWELNENWRISAFGLHSDNYAWDPGARGADPMERDGKFATEALLGAMTLEHHHRRADGRYQVYANRGEGRQLERPDGRPDAIWEFEHRGFSSREKLVLWPEGEVVLGVEHDIIYGEGGTEEQRFIWDAHRISSTYLAVSHRLGAGHNIHAIPSAGVRYYQHNRFDTETAPHAGFVLGRNNTEIHFGYSRGVLYPGLDVMVITDYVNPALGDSWENLAAETLDHYEVGISHTRDRFSADLTLFRDEGRNRYVIAVPPPPPPVFDNIGRYRIQGMETSLSYTPAETLALFAGLTLLDNDPGDMPYTPETSVSAGLNWRLMRRLRLSLDGQHVSSMYAGTQARRTGESEREKVGSHYLLNGKLSYLLALRTWNLEGEIFAAGENLTDKRYEYRPGYPMPGINGMAGLRLSW